jgi:hypothetical protein
MTGPEFEKGIVALTAWREMESEGLNGMIAVVFVLRSRAKAGWYGGSLYTNAIQKNQFSSMSVLGDKRTIAFPDTRDPVFQSLLAQIDAIYDGAPDTITNGALYFAVLDDSTSGWFKTNIVDRPDIHPRVAQIARTTFFK